MPDLYAVDPRDLPDLLAQAMEAVGLDDPDEVRREVERRAFLLNRQRLIQADNEKAHDNVRVKNLLGRAQDREEREAR